MPRLPQARGSRGEERILHRLGGWGGELSRRAEFRLAAAVADVEDAVLHADIVPDYRWATDCLLLRSESLNSSAIEGVHSSLEGLVAPPDKQSVADRTALGNWDMLNAAVEKAQELQPFTVEDVKELHHTLMIRSDNSQVAGIFRRGSDCVDELMDDLEGIINNSDLPPIFKATLVHAQFETIHPFADGNGQVGRALILVVLGRSGLTSGAPMPFSHALLENGQAYCRVLARYQRFTGDRADPLRWRLLEEMALLMADCAHGAAQQTREASSAVRAVMGKWSSKLADAGENSALWTVAEELVRNPVFTVDVMEEQTGLAPQAVHGCVGELKTRGILTTSGGRKNTVYTADDILEIADNVLGMRSRSASPKTANKATKSTEQSPNNGEASDDVAVHV